jgi:AcrR family transcriptional regulator
MATALAPGGAAMERLPPGRHGLPREQVRESQRRRLTAAATAALAERGYAGVTVTEVAKRAGVSTSSFYKHFDDLWACLLAAHGEGAELLCEQIEAACSGAEEGERVRAGVNAALVLFAAAPDLAQLLCGDPPGQAGALWTARRDLVSRLAAMLREARGGRGDGERELRLIGAALAVVPLRGGDGAARLGDLAPALADLLLAP